MRKVLGIYIGLGWAVEPDVRYLEFPQALPGKVLQVKKSLDEKDGRVKMISNLAEVSTVEDLLELERREAAARRLVTGTLSEDLHRRLGAMGAVETIRE